MNEPHTGFKVSVWNQEKNTHNTPNSHMNAWAVWVVHQGTGGAGRFTQPFHDLQLHYYNPSDGRELRRYDRSWCPVRHGGQGHCRPTR
jgi:hypothetical protein